MLTDDEREVMEAWLWIIQERLKEYATKRPTGKTLARRGTIKSLKARGIASGTLFGLLRFLRTRRCIGCERIVGPPNFMLDDPRKATVSHAMDRRTCSMQCSADANGQKGAGYDADGEPTEKELAEIEKRKASLLEAKRREASPLNHTPYEPRIYSLPPYRKTNALY